MTRRTELDENNSDSNSSQKMVDNSSREQLSKLKKKPSVDCPENKKEQTGNFLSRLVKKSFSGKKKSPQEVELSSSSFSDHNSEK